VVWNDSYRRTLSEILARGIADFRSRLDER
jgi:hypothetical protein